MTRENYLELLKQRNWGQVLQHYKDDVLKTWPSVFQTLQQLSGSPMYQMMLQGSKG